jgi:hypothetical protein
MSPAPPELFWAKIAFAPALVAVTAPVVIWIRPEPPVVEWMPSSVVPVT